MTHSLHRRGSVEDLHEDYVLMFYSSKGINREGAEGKMQQIWEVLSHYEQDLVNFGNHHPNWSGGELYNMDVLKKAFSEMNMAVFKDREKLKACLQEIKERDFGISVVVSGLYEETKKICSEIGLTPHTVNLSLGIHGNTEKLPEENVLEIHTMCGHAVVSFNLILHMVREIKAGRITCKEAARKLSRMCDCGLFNPYRAEKILRKMVTAQADRL
jgi:hypothetical protein